MKHLLTGLIAISAFTFSASAQTTENNQQSTTNNRDRGERNRMMMEKLNLTESQKDQMKSINQEFRGKMEDLRSRNLSDADMQSQRKALEEDRNSRISAILTDDQRRQWMDMRRDRKEGDQQNTGQWNRGDNNGQMGQGRGDDRMQQMRQDLGLSDDQAMRLKNSNESFRERSKAIMDNQSLSQEDRKAQFEKLRMEREENMRSILTADQYAKYTSMNGNRNHKEKMKDEDGKVKIKEKN